MMWLFDELIQKVGLYVPFYISNTVLRNIEGKNILDVGCGWGQPMKIMQLNKHGFHVIGVDIFRPYLIEAKRNKTHNEYVLCDVRKLPFKQKSFDTVLCMEVIEHLEKEEAIRLIEDMEKIARKKIIITTPVGFWVDYGRNGNPYQIHKSGFYPEDFKSKGYNVRAFGINKINSFKFHHLYLQKTIRRILRIIFSPFSYYLPRLGERMICTKKIDSFSHEEHDREYT